MIREKIMKQLKKHKKKIRDDELDAPLLNYAYRMTIETGTFRNILTLYLYDGYNESYRFIPLFDIDENIPKNDTINTGKPCHLSDG